MSTLLEIEAAAEALAPEEKAELVRFLTARLHSGEASRRAKLVAGPNGTLLLEALPGAPSQKARLVREGDDVLLEAPPGAPPMTTENIKRMLEDWP